MNEKKVSKEDKVMNRQIDVIIPIYKPNKEFIDVIEKLQNQTVKPNKIILMNTEEKFARKFIPLEVYPSSLVINISTGLCFIR